ncbi:Iron-dependent repressor IdeR [Posidoniimonas polymericola]|uniref:Transcriptional regulator MntR n=1 Tax=Posidoniimonas polymericola TaxID=2528002 RepID=A0A5C5YIH7_9BACT|nr:metal-dependent transcriptional regulator [Posidoniimonas polymericola]TWT74678.1 Iron-dependent repressor IdeR [Posidoniimonas polymericola]
MASLTVENYLKTIVHLAGEHEAETIATGQIAAALGVSPGTVTSMLKTLADSGLATYTPYEGVHLTASGERLAMRVIRRHRLIELFLVQTLGLSWDEVHDEAENMEHAVSDWLVDRIDAQLGFPSVDPHGEPIPASDGSIAAPSDGPLADHPPGVPFRVTRVVDQSPEFLRKLSDAGLEIGAEGRLAPPSTEGALVVQVDAGRRTLSADEASRVMVE